jgi:hypothetical protein
MMTGRVVVLFFTVILISACKREAAHLSPETMVPILVDLHLADAYSGIIRDTLKPSQGKNFDSLAVWTKSILKRHHTSEKEFNESMDWYRDRPEQLDSLFAKVIPILEHNRK